VIALRPDILVIDEPTTGQDPRMAQEIFEILRRLNQAGTTVLLITHNLGLAAEYATRAVVVKAGRIDFDGSFRELLPDLERLRANSLELPQTTLLASLLAAHGVQGHDTTLQIQRLQQFRDGGDRHVEQPVLARRAGVARRDVNPSDARRLSQPPGERVLATAATDYQ